jgi:carbamate kinase
MTTNKIAVVAVGGNSLILDQKRQTIPDQYEAAAISMHYVADMIEAGWNVVISHGNGPQVGFILRRSEIAMKEVIPVPMDYATADTQGAIGYMFQRALLNEFKRRGLNKKVITVVTQVLVDRGDPAFSTPSKPIGSFMDEATAQQRAAEQGWMVKEDAGRGWRRVVPSPLPQSVLELEIIKGLVETGSTVIACGGGGIPVFEDEEGHLQGIEAVIDKDLAASRLAQDLGADLFLISTAVEKVAINFGQPNQQWLDRLTLTEARRYEAEGHFASGSMGPKIKAVLNFIAGGGPQALITSPPQIGRALAGETGTVILPD